MSAPLIPDKRIFPRAAAPVGWLYCPPGLFSPIEEWDRHVASAYAMTVGGSVTEEVRAWFIAEAEAGRDEAWEWQEEWARAHNERPSAGHHL